MHVICGGTWQRKVLCLFRCHTFPPPKTNAEPARGAALAQYIGHHHVLFFFFLFFFALRGQRLDLRADLMSFFFDGKGLKKNSTHLILQLHHPYFHFNFQYLVFSSPLLPCVQTGGGEAEWYQMFKVFICNDLHKTTKIGIARKGSIKSMVCCDNPKSLQWFCLEWHYHSFEPEKNLKSFTFGLIKQLTAQKVPRKDRTILPARHKIFCTNKSVQSHFHARKGHKDDTYETPLVHPFLPRGLKTKIKTRNSSLSEQLKSCRQINKCVAETFSAENIHTCERATSPENNYKCSILFSPYSTSYDNTGPSHFSTLRTSSSFLCA